MAFRTIRFLLPTAVLLMAASPAAPPVPATVVLLARHAERAPGSGDVPLSEAGQARARALAEVGKVAGVEVIITTQFQRTKQTAGPLAEALGITMATVATGSDVAAHMADVATAVKRHPGKTVLVVGHSNTIPGIVTALGGPRLAELCETEYDNLFTVILDAEGGVRTVRSKFGVATPVDGTCNPMR